MTVKDASNRQISNMLTSYIITSIAMALPGFSLMLPHRSVQGYDLGWSVDIDNACSVPMYFTWTRDARDPQSVAANTKATTQWTLNRPDDPAANLIVSQSADMGRRMEIVIQANDHTTYYADGASMWPWTLPFNFAGMTLLGACGPADTASLVNGRTYPQPCVNSTSFSLSLCPKA